MLTYGIKLKQTNRYCHAEFATD